ncbi:hypothetical protein J6590_012396 [Homalodisca vitripennis]|nr:hypothetical protein J6590_012396 [Homalodisca vitripennis]
MDDSLSKAVLHWFDNATGSELSLFKRSSLKGSQSENKYYNNNELIVLTSFPRLAKFDLLAGNQRWNSIKLSRVKCGPTSSWGSGVGLREGRLMRDIGRTVSSPAIVGPVNSHPACKSLHNNC